MTFKIKKENKEKRHITINLSPDKYDAVTKSALKENVSIKEFCRQALAYAMGWK